MEGASSSLYPENLWFKLQGSAIYQLGDFEQLKTSEFQ